MAIRHNGNKKKRIYERDHGICHYCAEDCLPFGEGKFNQKRSSTLDHVQTRAAGGNNHDQNLVLACHSCNNMRSCIPYAIFKSRRLWNNPTACAKFARLFTIGAQRMKEPTPEGVYILEMYNEGTRVTNVQTWGVFANAQAVHAYMATVFPDAMLVDGDEDGFIGYRFPWDHTLTDVSFVANIWDLIR